MLVVGIHYVVKYSLLVLTTNVTVEKRRYVSRSHQPIDSWEAAFSERKRLQQNARDG